MKTKEILNKTIKDAQAVIDKAKADMAELDKPKYRFGDYGTAKLNRNDQTIYIINGGDKSMPLTLLPWMSDNEMYYAAEFADIHIVGNYIDDLKRNEVDLEGFEVTAKCAHDTEGFSAFIDGVVSINIGNIGDIWSYSLDQAIEIHQKLGQLIATYKRRKARER